MPFRSQQGFSPSHIYAQSSTNLAINAAFPQSGSDEAGRDFVYFGGYGSGRWAQWRKPDGTKAWIPIYHSFVAYNPNGSHGHYLGCSAQESGDAERQCYFGVDWSPNGYTFYANGKKVGEQNEPVSNVEQFVLISTEPGGYRKVVGNDGGLSDGRIEWGKPSPALFDAVLPDFFEVDFVRVFDAV